MQENRTLLGNRAPSTRQRSFLCLALFTAAVGGLVFSIGISELLTLTDLDEIELAERCENAHPNLPLEECRSTELTHIIYLMLAGLGGRNYPFAGLDRHQRD